MNFNSFLSLEYAALLAGTTFLFFAAPAGARVGIIVVAGAWFASWFAPGYLGALFLIILIGYAAGLGMTRPEPLVKRIAFAAGVAAAVAVPLVLKSTAFGDTLIGSAHALRWHGSVDTLGMLMPIGLAFHSFQTIGYLDDVRRGQTLPETNLLRHASTVLFFPQMTAGPIERPADLLRQLDAGRPFDPVGASRGLQRILWGLFKKSVIADQLAVFVDPVFGAPMGQPGLLLLLASLGFAVQIYCDFSGYCDMACGSAEVLGVRIHPNFNAPFLAQSFRDYWRRWNVSFSEWIRDRIYLPLGGARGGTTAATRNLLAAFMIGGLCYGTRWTFLVWAALNASTIFITERAGAGRPDGRGGMRSVGVFAVTAIIWIFFRSATLADAAYIITHLFSGADQWLKISYWSGTVWSMGVSGFGKRQWFFLIVFIAALIVVERKQVTKGWIIYLPPGLGRSARWVRHYLLVMILLFFGVFRHQFGNI